MSLIVHVCGLWYSLVYQVGTNKGIIKDARTNKSQDLHCKTSKTDIPLQEDQNKIAQNQRGHLVQRQ